LILLVPLEFTVSKFGGPFITPTIVGYIFATRVI